jgi:hypothetical protein
MDLILSLIFSKFGALGGVLALLGGLWFRGWWYKRQADTARRERDGLLAQAEISQAQISIQAETEKKEEKIDEMVQEGDAAGMSAYFNRGVQPGDKN